MIPLQGTIESVRLRRPYQNNIAYGEIIRNGQPIYVGNGRQLLEHGTYKVLVRTDTLLPRIMENKDNPNLHIQSGQWISSENHPIVEAWKGLNAHEYILIADLKVEGSVWPTLDQMNEYFDPGRFGRVPYFPNNTGPGMWISNQGPFKEVSSFEDAIYYHMERGKVNNSSAVFTESESQVSKLEIVIIENGLIPVRMESLKNYK